MGGRNEKLKSKREEQSPAALAYFYCSKPISSVNMNLQLITNICCAFGFARETFPKFFQKMKNPIPINDQDEAKSPEPTSAASAGSAWFGGKQRAAA